jgi:hypothetical protein
MSTNAQIIANRNNAQKSTGPKTLQGKQIASQNSLKHGLTAANDIISAESRPEFDLYRSQMLSELAPQSVMESMLAERVVSLSWRLKRIRRIQNQAIDALSRNNGNDLFSKLKKSLFSKSLVSQSHSPVDDDSSLALGRLAVKDFSNGRVLERLLMYERRLENSLYKTILELQRLNLINQYNDIQLTNTRI